ncbi:hypothetical protein H4S07_004465 [Coemansia furcata]|uniref:Uncharacterized protein n=1 Tax=Coemansia furcata TaxID=417177 RepID=A0ACC1L889_9FUNG|nr:hypothetical protein H4S07_004465 [Coemansia furcata]
MGDSASTAPSATLPLGGGEHHNILKRMSVYQQQRRVSRNIPNFDTEDGYSPRQVEDISLHDDTYSPSRPGARRQSSMAASVRSSIYYLDDGSVQPYTGYAFAQQERPPQPSARHAERGRHLRKRPH